MSDSHKACHLASTGEICATIKLIEMALNCFSKRCGGLLGWVSYEDCAFGCSMSKVNLLMLNLLKPPLFYFV